MSQFHIIGLRKSEKIYAGISKSESESFPCLDVS